MELGDDILEMIQGGDTLYYRKSFESPDLVETVEKAKRNGWKTETFQVFRIADKNYDGLELRCEVPAYIQEKLKFPGDEGMVFSYYKGNCLTYSLYEPIEKPIEEISPQEVIILPPDDDIPF